MTKQEFYEYITSQITPEEALMRFIEAGLGHYEKLKFNKGEEIHPLILISMAAMDMGWQFCIEKETENVEGLVLGTEDYMKRTIK